MMLDIIKTQYMNKATKGYSEYFAKDNIAREKIKPVPGDRCLMKDGRLFFCWAKDAWEEVSGKGSSSSGITVDAELSDTSENPVQNKVINEALEALKNYVNQAATVFATPEYVDSAILNFFFSPDGEQILQEAIQNQNFASQAYVDSAIQGAGYATLADVDSAVASATQNMPTTEYVDTAIQNALFVDTNEVIE